jgi:peptide/nickel transport system permease protein
MLAFMARRLVYAMVTLVFISLAGFFIINLPAGSYLDVFIQQLEAQGTLTSEAQIQTLKQQYGLDHPLYVQYYKWITGFVRGDFGRSFAYNQPVRNLIGSRLGFTALISLCSLLLTWLIAIPIGVYTATHQYSLGDHAATIIGLAGLSIPNFVLALFLMIVASRAFGQHIGGLFSPQFLDAPWSWAKFVDLLNHLWVPVVILATSGTAGLIRIMRGNLLDVLNMQYVQAARARGVSERAVIVKHAVRNAMHPLVMMLGMSLPGIISGATIIDIVLNLPTTGPMYFNALQQKDMYLAGTFLMFLSIMLVIGNFLADLLLAWVDPRIRLD